MIRKSLFLNLLLLITATPSLLAMEGSQPMEQTRGTKRKASQISVKSAPIILTTENGAKFELEPGADQLSGTIKGFLKELENEMIATEQEKAAEIFIPGDTKPVELFAQIANELQKKINQETGTPLDEIIEKNLPQIAETQLKNGEIQDFKNLLQLTHYLEMPTSFEDAAASLYITKMAQEGLGPQNIQDISIFDTLGFYPPVSLLLKKNWITHQPEGSEVKTLLAHLEQTVQDKINQETNLSPSWRIQAPNGHIIAISLQRFVNTLLKNQTANNLLLLLVLTHLLEKPMWLENAIASAYVAQALKENIAPIKKENLEAWINNLGLSPSTNELLEKHWLLQKIRAEELSVKDLLAMGESVNIEFPTSLYLSRKALTSLEGLQEVPGIDTVTKLVLNGNNLIRLPENIFNGLNNLKYLCLENNSLITLPNNIFDDLSNLEQLHLENNSLVTLPDNIFNRLNSLEELLLNNNSLSILPESIFNGLNNLKELHLNDNNLSILPENIFNGLNELWLLHLNNNNLSTLPDNIFNHLKRLSCLYLGNNNLSTLPSTIFNGLNLGSLNLENNTFSTLSNNIFNDLNNLSCLVIDKKLFAALSDNIFNNLKNLARLVINYYQLLENEKKKIESKLKKIAPKVYVKFRCTSPYWGRYRFRSKW